jgi:mono/diheme cytochrome c family protein
LIGDPTKSHFFNTDCVSCHTETTLAVGLLQFGADPRIDPQVLPKDPWNVRNFGWSPFGGATVTRRTAAETGAVVKFINSNLVAK